MTKIMENKTHLGSKGALVLASNVRGDGGSAGRVDTASVEELAGVEAARAHEGTANSGGGSRSRSGDLSGSVANAEASSERVVDGSERATNTASSSGAALRRGLSEGTDRSTDNRRTVEKLW